MPNLASTAQSTSRGTESKALTRSTNSTHDSSPCSRRRTRACAQPASLPVRRSQRLTHQAAGHRQPPSIPHTITTCLCPVRAPPPHSIDHRPESYSALCTDAIEAKIPHPSDANVDDTSVGDLLPPTTKTQRTLEFIALQGRFEFSEGPTLKAS